MENDLISKKELLELTGISYGQLYRWKRKNLIPEEWFVRKSAFTGQETFFHRQSILSRIDKIKNMKEDLSLDDIAGVFSPEQAEITLRRQEIADRGIISTSVMDSFADEIGEENISFQKLLHLFIAQKLLQSGDIGMEEAKNVVATLGEGYITFEGKGCDVVVTRKLGISSCFLIGTSSPLHVEKGAKLVTRAELARFAEELKMKI